jgi:hypothetical protein
MRVLVLLEDLLELTANQLKEGLKRYLSQYAAILQLDVLVNTT